MDCSPPAPLSTGFSRQEYWSGLPFPSPRILPNSGIEPTALKSSALADEFFTISASWEAQAPQTIETKKKGSEKGIRGEDRSYPALIPEGGGVLKCR